MYAMQEESNVRLMTNNTNLSFVDQHVIKYNVGH